MADITDEQLKSLGLLHSFVFSRIVGKRKDGDTCYFDLDCGHTRQLPGHYWDMSDEHWVECEECPMTPETREKVEQQARLLLECEHEWEVVDGFDEGDWCDAWCPKCGANKQEGIMSEVEESKYTVAEIKAAFQASFFKAGELWFDYLGTDEDAQRSVDNSWEQFYGNLTNPTATRIVD